VCGIKPHVGEPDFLDGIGEANAQEFELALQGEAALRPFVMKNRAGIIDADPEVILETLATPLPEIDRGRTYASRALTLGAGVADGAR
jgi:hypothetical protein